MNWKETKICKSSDDFLDTKRRLIIEAINFKSGTLEKQIKTTILNLPITKKVHSISLEKKLFVKIPIFMICFLQLL
jgi:hypothetical protein